MCNAKCDFANWGKVQGTTRVLLPLLLFLLLFHYYIIIISNIWIDHHTQHRTELNWAALTNSSSQNNPRWGYAPMGALQCNYSEGKFIYWRAENYYPAERWFTDAYGISKIHGTYCQHSATQTVPLEGFGCPSGCSLNSKTNLTAYSSSVVKDRTSIYWIVHPLQLQRTSYIVAGGPLHLIPLRAFGSNWFRIYERWPQTTVPINIVKFFWAIDKLELWLVNTVLSIRQFLSSNNNSRQATRNHWSVSGYDGSCDHNGLQDSGRGCG